MTDLILYRPYSMTRPPWHVFIQHRADVRHSRPSDTTPQLSDVRASVKTTEYRRRHRDPSQINQ